MRSLRNLRLPAARPIKVSGPLAHGGSTMKYVFTLLLLVFAVPAFAQDTPTLKDLSPSFKEPAQDAFDTVQRFTETSESVKLDTQKALAKAKHNITTDADRYAYKLLEAQFNSQSAFDGWHDYARELLTKSEGKDKEGHYLPAEDRDPSISNLYSKQFHETLDLATPFGVARTQC